MEIVAGLERHIFHGALHVPSPHGGPQRVRIRIEEKEFPFKNIREFPNSQGPDINGCYGSSEFHTLTGKQNTWAGFPGTTWSDTSQCLPTPLLQFYCSVRAPES